MIIELGKPYSILSMADTAVGLCNVVLLSLWLVSLEVLNEILREVFDVLRLLAKPKDAPQKHLVKL